MTSNFVDLTQPNLIDIILNMVLMTACHTKATPTTLLMPLGSDEVRQPNKETWSYSSIVGMLLYLAGKNAHPDIAFVVNQAAHYTHLS